MADLIDFEHLNMLKEVIGDDLKDILQVFVETAPNEVAAMQETLAKGDAEGLRLHAHTLKGSAANVGASLLSQQSKEIEESAKVADLSGIGDGLTELENTLNQVLSSLKDYKDEI